MMRYLYFVVGLVCVLSLGCSSAGPVSQSNYSPSTRTFSGDDAALTRAFEQGLSSIQVEGQGVVRRVLEDDDNEDGGRHQRFVVALTSGQTLLIAHNIDRAPRIVGLSEGDIVSFSGEYIWNAEGGVIHWTHRDRNKRHPPGWIRHNGDLYQ